MLSGPQRKFCERIVAGDSNTAAYLAAYPKSSKAAATSSASTLLTVPNILEEIDRLKKLAENAFTMTRLEWLNSFARLAKAAEDGGDFAAAKGCLREIGLAMPGWYEPEQIDGKIEVVIREL